MAIDIKKEIYNIIDIFDGSGKIEECKESIGIYLSRQHDEVKTFNILIDTDDVFDSCDMDIFYIFVSWIDKFDYLQMCSKRFTVY